MKEATLLTKKIAPFGPAEQGALGLVKAGNRSWVGKGDGTKWLNALPKNTLHAIVTDPPYGVKEYDADQIEKMKNGSGGVWRIPPSFDGNVRAPLPRFTALDSRERVRITTFFTDWANAANHALKPGGHVIIATNSFLAPLVYAALSAGGLEFRGQLIRLVRTLRGGDRPKNAELEFPDASVIPRGCFEPWGIFRKALPEKMTVAECLRTYGTGALRRQENGKPFEDVVESERTPKRERNIANHPSIKPQSLLRKLVRAVLPTGRGVVADPFMGSGSTIAAAEAVGAQGIGVEISAEYFELARQAIPELSNVAVRQESSLFE